MKSRFDVALRLSCAALPAALAASGAAAGALAAHDDGVVRTVGLGFAGAFRTLDLLVAAPLVALPMGPRVVRAALAGALVTGACGAIAFELAKTMTQAVVPAALRRVGLRDARPSPRLLSTVAAAAVLAALLSPAWQSEAAAPGGAVTGALLVLVATALAVQPAVSSAAMAFVLGLAASYEPLVFVAAAAPFAPRAMDAVRGLVRGRVRLAPRRLAMPSGAFVLGLVPLGVGLALAWRAPDAALFGPTLSLIERAAHPVSLGAFASAEIGALLLMALAAGAVAAMIVPKARRTARALGLVVSVGAAATALGMAAGPARFGAPLLAALACGHVLAAIGLGAVVVAIGQLRVPFAEASAALVVVLELVLPVRAVDETMTRREAPTERAATIWNDVAWGAVPPAAVVLVADRTVMRRVASARATGEMRGDLVVVPAFDVQSRQGARALAAEPELAPLYRDLALGLAPEELSLARLGGERAVVGTFDPTWSRTLARSLVPVGLVSRYEPEPRGIADRRRAFGTFTPHKERLARAIVANKDDVLVDATARLLRARAIGVAATGEREPLSLALDELRAFSPEDPIGAALVRRIVTTKGRIDVRDLTP